MSFWNTSDNEQLKPNDGSFDAGGGNLEPIPHGTTVLAAPLECKWITPKDPGEPELINIQWVVLGPAAYKNRRVFQKVRVYDTDPKKADKAKRMLAAIDSNAGGKLLAAGKEPTDATLTQCLVNKPMMLKLGVWEIEDKTGNWVQAVAPKNGAMAAPSADDVALSGGASAAPAPAAAPAAATPGDDIPW